MSHLTRAAPTGILRAAPALPAPPHRDRGRLRTAPPCPGHCPLDEPRRTGGHRGTAGQSGSGPGSKGGWWLGAGQRAGKDPGWGHTAGWGGKGIAGPPPGPTTLYLPPAASGARRETASAGERAGPAQREPPTPHRETFPAATAPPGTDRPPPPPSLTACTGR